MASGTKSVDREGAADGVRGARQTDSLLNTLADYCYPLYRRLFGNRAAFTAAVDRKLAESLRETTVELFLSRALALGLVLGSLLTAGGLVVGYAVTNVLFSGEVTLLGLVLPDTLATVVELLKVPFLILLSGLVFGTTGFAIGFGFPLFDVYYEAYERDREIDLLLPDAIAYMYALSVGGMNHIEILNAVAEAEEVYGEVSREFQTIVQETRYFDTDYRTAIHTRSTETPNQPLSQFFTDMLSVVNSGGDVTQFFDEKSTRHLDISTERQENILDTLELIGEMYLAISLFPLLLIILLVVVSLLGQGSTLLLYITVYGLIPVIGLTFLVIISIVKRDEPSEGYLEPPGTEDTETSADEAESALTRPTTAAYRERHPIFRQIDRKEALHQLRNLLVNPHELFVGSPLATLLVTVPLALLSVAYFFLSGIAPTSPSGFVASPTVGTVLYVYVPAFLVLVPLAVFREWYVRDRYGVLDNLTENLRKLSSANDTGLTLLESFRTVADTSPGKLGREFDHIYARVTYGTSLKHALVRFNNRYRIPRLARVVKLIAEAQETSSEITAVLTTAAQTSENQDKIARSRESRTQMQIAIVVMTFLTMLGVMAILKVQFIDTIASVVAASDSGASSAGAIGGNVDVSLLSMLFFHAVTLQAVTASLLAGYLKDSSLMSGVKYMVGLLSVTALVWIAVS